MPNKRKRKYPSLGSIRSIIIIASTAVVVSIMYLLTSYLSEADNFIHTNSEMSRFNLEKAGNMVNSTVPVLLLLGHYEKELLQFQKNIEIYTLNPDASRHNFKRHYVRLAKMNKDLKMLMQGSYTKYNYIFNDTKILEDIVREAADNYDVNSMLDLSNDARESISEIAVTIADVEQEIESEYKRVRDNLNISTQAYSDLSRNWEETHNIFHFFYYMLALSIVIIPAGITTFVFHIFSKRVGHLEVYAENISKEEYGLPPFSAKDSTGHLAVKLGLLGRRTRNLITASRRLTKEAETARDQASLMANRDPLTGLANRRYFTEYLAKENSRLSVTPKFLIFLDLDNFKDINDHLGHDMGDALLITVSDRLVKIVRPTDIVARLGGDEFALIIDCPEDYIVSMVNRILDSIVHAIHINDTILHISTSIGVTLLRETTTDISEYLKQADIAMYHAKNNGKNSYKFFSRDLQDKLSLKQTMLTEVRKAIELEQMLVYFQPKVNLATTEVEGCEALVRWNHPQRGIVGPGEFLSYIEKSNLMLNLGEWVLWESCRKMKFLHDKGIKYPFSVNVSVNQFYAQGFVNLVDRAISETGLSASYLELEITETMLMQNLDQAKHTLRQLRDLGVSIAIDDFGVGYSSMGYLRELPINTIKIDRIFIANIHDDVKCRAIVEAILAMGKRLDMCIIAEGVETADQVKALVALGCDIAQGYYFARPMSFEDFESEYFPRANVYQLRV